MTIKKTKKQYLRKRPSGIVPASVYTDEDAIKEFSKGDRGFEDLAGVLAKAYRQAAGGKGLERHGGGAVPIPFNRQRILEIARGPAGLGFLTGQVQKKVGEANDMANRGERDAAIHEMMGAIVYLGAAIIRLDEVNGTRFDPSNPDRVLRRIDTDNPDVAIDNEEQPFYERFSDQDHGEDEDDL